MCCTYPMNRSFHLAIGSRTARFALEIDAAAQFRHLTRFIFYNLVALDNVGVFESHFSSGFHRKGFGVRGSHEMCLVEETLTAERHLTASRCRTVGIITACGCVDLIFG